jgi:hypothetical protein
MTAHESCPSDPGRPAPLRLLFVGQSHVQVLRRDVPQIQSSVSSFAQRPVEFNFLFLHPSGNSLYRSTALEEAVPVLGNWLDQPEGHLEDAAPLFEGMDYVLVLWRGEQLSVSVTFAFGPEFDVVLPGERDEPTPAGVELVPYAVVEETMLAAFDSDPAFRAALGFLSSPRWADKLRFLAPPPPLPVEAVRERLAIEPFFVEMARNLGIDLAAAPLVPDRVRVKVWKVFLSVYESLAGRYGCRLIPPPGESADERGTLAPAYWGHDVTHAGVEYGRLYLEKILSSLSSGDVS